MMTAEQLAELKNKMQAGLDQARLQAARFEGALEIIAIIQAGGIAEPQPTETEPK